MRIIVTTGLFVALASAQSAPAASVTNPSFEVASIKVAPPPTDGRLMIRMNSDGGRINYSNVSLRDLMKAAYQVKDHQISGPDWLGFDRFDVTAKLPEGATKDQIPAMLQTLLADRFKLQFHKDPKVVPAYALVAGKGGLKLHTAETEVPMRMMMGPKGHHLSGSGNMQRVADLLSNFMDRPVIDRTEAKGIYDIDLEWTGDDGHDGPGRFMRGPGGPGPSVAPGAPDGTHSDPSADAPSIFTALQDKLGLKLDPRKEQVDILIIDHAEKVPTEN